LQSSIVSRNYVFKAMNKSPIKIFKKTRTIEEFNRLYIKILQSCQSQNNRTIMVASCNKGEGSSTIAVNLSRIIAKKNNGKILLIDANWRNSIIERVFNIDRIPGLADIISKNVELDVSIKKTEIENLEILTAGSAVSDPVSVLNSEKVTNCLEKLKKDYSVIILDSPPVIPFSDSLYLSSVVDMFLLVIEAEKTRWEVAQEAIQKISAAKVKTFGTILNKKKDHIPTMVYKKI